MYARNDMADGIAKINPHAQSDERALSVLHGSTQALCTTERPALCLGWQSRLDRIRGLVAAACHCNTVYLFGLMLLFAGFASAGCDQASTETSVDAEHDAHLDLSSHTDIAPGDVSAGEVVSPTSIHITGYAFAFAGLGQPVANATIRIAEWPDLVVQTAEDGTYTLQVPNTGTFTPYAEHENYKTMYLQTFSADGIDLHNVNFQMVEPFIYDLMASAVGVTPDPATCQIATTVNTIDIRDMTLDEFKAYGPHGVAGAVVWSEPALDVTVYFNASVVPEPSLTETSGDGGVVWPNVPPGVYTFGANHSDKPFASFVATCEPGRFINAGPPWGIRELEPSEAGDSQP